VLYWLKIKATAGLLPISRLKTPEYLTRKSLIAYRWEWEGIICSFYVSISEIFSTAKQQQGQITAKRAALSWWKRTEREANLSMCTTCNLSSLSESNVGRTFSFEKNDNLLGNMWHRTKRQKVEHKACYITALVYWLQWSNKW